MNRTILSKRTILWSVSKQIIFYNGPQILLLRSADLCSKTDHTSMMTFHPSTKKLECPRSEYFSICSHKLTISDLMFFQVSGWQPPSTTMTAQTTLWTQMLVIMMNLTLASSTASPRGRSSSTPSTMASRNQISAWEGVNLKVRAGVITVSYTNARVILYQ